MTPARHHLRLATRETHARTDAAFSTLDLAAREDYALFLSSHWLAYRALEPVFAARLPRAQRPPAMATLLADDLDTLGAGLPVAAPPAFGGDALGAAYVVAGSHFGKRVLSRRHGRSADARVRAGNRYLASPALAAYWPTLQAAIEAVPAASLGQTTRGADAAFALFADCLARARAAQRPVQSGARFDRNAARPSRKSALV